MSFSVGAQLGYSKTSYIEILDSGSVMAFCGSLFFLIFLYYKNIIEHSDYSQKQKSYKT
jgi:hypothetical protein